MAHYTESLERRFSDLDLLGHVNNVMYHDYLQEARIRVTRRLRKSGLPIPPQVLARQEIDHLRPLHLRTQPIRIDMWIESVGRSSYVMRAEILDDDGTLSARARSVLVAFDKETERSTPLPQGFRDYLLGLVEVAD